MPPLSSTCLLLSRFSSLVLLFFFSLFLCFTHAHRRLDDNKLATLPACLDSLKSLKLLTLNKNALTALPDLKNLTALTELALASNSFSAFPVPVCALPALTRLDLTLNRIATIPADCAETSVATLFVFPFSSPLFSFLFFFLSQLCSLPPIQDAWPQRLHGVPCRDR